MDDNVKTNEELLQQAESSYNNGVVHERPEWIQQSMAASLLVIATCLANREAAPSQEQL